MAGWYLTGDAKFAPDKMVSFAQENGYYSPGNGSKWTLISEGAEQLGLSARELPLVKKKMVDALKAGNPIILALGPGDFTASGHYIVLTAWAHLQRRRRAGHCQHSGVCRPASRR